MIRIRLFVCLTRRPSTEARSSSAVRVYCTYPSCYRWWCRCLIRWRHRLPEWRHRLPEWRHRLPEWRHRLPEWRHRLPEWRHRLSECRHRWWCCRVALLGKTVSFRQRRDGCNINERNSATWSPAERPWHCHPFMMV